MHFKKVFPFLDLLLYVMYLPMISEIFFVNYVTKQTNQFIYLSSPEQPSRCLSHTVVLYSFTKIKKGTKNV